MRKLSVLLMLAFVLGGAGLVFTGASVSLAQCSDPPCNEKGK